MKGRTVVAEPVGPFSGAASSAVLAAWEKRRKEVNGASHAARECEADRGLCHLL